jgi:hypothetical protein
MTRILSFEPELEDLDPVRDLDWSKLPRKLAELRPVLGPLATLRLARSFGGKLVYVPIVLRANHPLVRCLGREGAAALIARHGGESFVVPKYDCVLRQLRQRRLRRLREQGVSISALAQTFNLSRRRVHQILAA